MSCPILLAGFQPSLIGRFWVSPEGNYNLEQFEGGLYYIQRSGHRKDGGGYLDGTVEYLGWTDKEIFVKRRSTWRGDPDGWMVIDFQSDTVRGPFSEEAFRGRYPKAIVVTPAEGWKRL